MCNSHALYLSFLLAERNAAVEEAIVEAKAHLKMKEEMRKAQVASSGPVRSTAKYFKQVSKEARRQGEAREKFEDMVRRAERKLAEVQRKSHTNAQSAETRAEELATELFHMPGSMLKKEEIARMKMESECIGRQEQPNCFTPNFQHFRTIDGTCNNLENPFLGAADTPLVRIIPSQYEDGIGTLRGGLQNRKGKIFELGPFTQPNPSPRLVSETVIRNVSEDEELTHILMQWGQFIDHDMTLVPELEDNCTERAKVCEFTNICEPIRVADRDPIFGVGTENNAQCIPFSRSIAGCEDEEEPLVNGAFRPREQINVLTSFIDGSMIYGSNEEVAREIRLFKGGLLREGQNFPGNKPELPRISVAENVREEGEPFVGCPNPGQLGCFLTGEFRVNEQVVLTVMHTLWFREHNRIARELAVINPQWSDERLYQETRKIVGALIQKITYNDFLLHIFGQQVYNIVLGEYAGFDPRINPGVTNAFATAAFRFGHTLIRPFFKRLDSKYLSIGAGPLSLVDAFINPDQFRESFGTDPITRGLVTENSRRVDEFLTSALTNQLFRENLDLASLNIQRGRGHGLPPYITWQRYCNTVFPQLPKTNFDNTLTLVRFLQVYGSLDTVDLWIGGLAEDRLPGSLLGPTFACLFGISFANIRDGDRFFFLRPGLFKPQQVEQIKQDTLSRVICDNSDNINNIQKDAFLAGTPRVPCSTLPRIDLSLWKEEPCYFRVNVRPRTFTMPIRSYSRSSPADTFSFFPRNVPANSVAKSVCVPMICPKLGGSSELILYTSKFLNGVVTLAFNNQLPPNLLQPVFESYRAVLPYSLFGNGIAGLFKSVSACQASSTVAFTIGLKSTAQEIGLEQNLLELLNEQTSDVSNPESTDGNEEVPDFLIDILRNDEQTVVTPSPPTSAAPSETESEAQLMSDLEDALKSLNV